MMTDSPERPLITFALFAYNQERFIAEAVHGALNQTYSPLEVFLSDDCSTDRTFEIMQEIAATYRGLHTIVLNRNEQNLGLAGHINRVMKMVKGRVIVVAAGDDVSLPDRVMKTHALFAASGGRAKSIFGNALIIDDSGREHGLYLPQGEPDPNTLTARWMAQHLSGVLGCTHAWHREVFDVFDSIDNQIYQEDLIIPWRSALLGEVAYINEVLVKYRVHDSNLYFRTRSYRWKLSSVRQDLERQSRNKVAICHARLADLDRWRAAPTADESQYAELKELMLARLAEAEMETTLYGEKRFGGRAKLVLEGYRYRLPRRTLIRWTLSALLPLFYVMFLEYVDLRIRTRRRHLAV